MSAYATPQDTTSSARPSHLDARAVQSVLPHRPPFLFVDRVSEGTPERVVAWRHFRPDEAFFRGHFPQNPIVPGVLLVEALAQASLLLYWYNFGSTGLLVLTKDVSRFRHPVFPGDLVRLEVTKVKAFPTMGRCVARATVGDTIVADSEITFARVQDDAEG